MHSTYDDGIKLSPRQTAMAFHGTWASGRLMNGKGFDTGVFLPPWNDSGKAAVPVIGSETGFAVCETAHKEAATRFLEFITGRASPSSKTKRQNISPFKAAPGAHGGRAAHRRLPRPRSAAPVTGSPYYSMLPANTIDMLHPLIQEVLPGKVTPQQAARRLDASIRNEARKNYK